MAKTVLVLLCLGPLDAVLGALAVAGGFVGRRRPGSARGVERSAHDVVAHAGEIFDAAAANEHDRVLLEVVALAGDVAGHFHAVREPDATHLAKRRVGLLRGRRVDAHANPPLLRAGLEGRGRRLESGGLAALANQLVDGRHESMLAGFTLETGAGEPPKRPGFRGDAQHTRDNSAVKVRGLTCLGDPKMLP